MAGENTLVVRSVARTREWLQSTGETLDTTRLKRVGVVTYFGVYAFIAFGGRGAVNGLLGVLPPLVRPPALAPLHQFLGLPRSFAWALVSFATALAVVCVLITGSLHREAGDRPPRLGDASIRETVAPAARVRWAGRRLRRGLTTADEATDVDRPSHSSDADTRFSFDTTNEALPAADRENPLFTPRTYTSQEVSAERDATADTGVTIGSTDGAERDVDEGPSPVPRDGTDDAEKLADDGGSAVNVSTAATVGTALDQPTTGVDGTSTATDAGIVDDAEILTDDDDATDDPSTTDADGDADRGAADNDREAADEGDDGADRDGEGESLDEIAPWPGETDTTDAEAFDEDAEAFAEDAAWPSGWISGDDL